MRSICPSYPGDSRIQKVIGEVQQIYRDNFFPEMNAKWSSYPENIGHKDWQGCFRCHDDSHKSADGKKIIESSNCNACHTLIAQGKGNELMQLTPQGQEFKHPDGEKVEGGSTIAIMAACETNMNPMIRRFTAARTFMAATALIFLGLVSVRAAEEFKNQDCLDCHNDPSNVRKVKGKEVPLELFTTNRFEKSVHAKLACGLIATRESKIWCMTHPCHPRTAFPAMRRMRRMCRQRKIMRIASTSEPHAGRLGGGELLGLSRLPQHHAGEG